MHFIFKLSDYLWIQTASPFNGFIVIVIVKLKQKKIIIKRENRDLCELGQTARNPVNKSQVWQINIFCII